jgi:peptidoglycan hydrolase-like protein with peptidoglycan-binding domain
MRFAGAILLASSLALPVFMGLLSQPNAAPAEATKKTAVTKKALPANKAAAAKKAPAATKPIAQKKPAPVAQPGRDVYPNMPLPERVGIQFDLAWSGHYNGLIDGAFNDKSIAAVRAFQRDYKFRETGVLAPPERALVATLAKAKQDQVGWRMIDDRATGAQVGIPTRQAPNTSLASRGTRWSSAQGQVQIETFRIREPGATLATVFEQQKKEPANRKLEVNLLRDNIFILSGTQGLKKFYVRAEARDLEIRGLTVLWDPATEVIMDPVVVVMSSAFAPFPGSGLAGLMGPPPRRKVEYGTGVLVSAAGHVLTDRALTDDCNIVEVAGYGDAHRVAEDSAAGLALLRIFRASDLAPLPLSQDGTMGTDLILVGIADPKTQGGGRAPSIATVRRSVDGLQPPPQPGFAGAAAFDAQGRFVGLVTLKTPVVANAGPTSVPASQTKLVTASAVRKFLDAQSITPSVGIAGINTARAAAVRIICVRH